MTRAGRLLRGASPVGALQARNPHSMDHRIAQDQRRQKRQADIGCDREAGHVNIGLAASGAATGAEHRAAQEGTDGCGARISRRNDPFKGQGGPAS